MFIKKPHLNGDKVKPQLMKVLLQLMRDKDIRIFPDVFFVYIT
jgi:hypothetical protein